MGAAVRALGFDKSHFFSRFQCSHCWSGANHAQLRSSLPRGLKEIFAFGCRLPGFTERWRDPGLGKLLLM